MISIIFTAHFAISKAQDTLYYVGGKKEVVSVKEINPKEIRYTFLDAKTGPVIVIKRGKVNKIAFSDGRKLELNSVEEKRLQASANKHTPLESFHRHNVWFSLTEVFVGRLNFTYEHIIGKKGWFSYRIPLSVSLKDSKALFSANYYDSYSYSTSGQYEMNGQKYDLSLTNKYSNNSDFPNPIRVLNSGKFYLNFGNSVHTGIGGRCYIGGQRMKNFFVGAEL